MFFLVPIDFFERLCLIFALNIFYILLDISVFYDETGRKWAENTSSGPPRDLRIVSPQGGLNHSRHLKGKA